ncbi:hypothetical protein EJ04DRAFT_289076 [Polyplosphaeria fusca]|uniref:Uncharacterized protein n=1 Tax=Polyplosphaeria fusca TaxID=682080 RepID=A0A9P4V7X3_9PLEO|nr:hypothetical protein EJ04DRAFT_289076 [Polyplosphaeria fusca]
MTPTPTTPDEATETSDPSESIDSNSTDDFDGGDDDNTPTPTTHIIATITPEPPTPPEFDPNFNPGPDSECTTLCDRPTQAPTSSLSDDPDTTYKTAISVLPHPEPPVAPPPPPEAYSTYHDPRHVAARTAAPLTLATTVIPKPTARVVGKAQLGHLTEGYEWTHSSAETFATPTAFALPSKPTRKVDRVMNKGVFGKEELMKAIGLGSLMGKNEDEDEDRKQ